MPTCFTDSPDSIMQKKEPDKFADKDFLEWVEKQPSCLDGSFSEYENGEGRNVACHVRRVAYGAGTAKKPLFFAVPMTHWQHALQHQKGEKACMMKYLKAPRGKDFFAGKLGLNEATAKDWFETQALAYRIKYELLHPEEG